jgi:transcriptional pleiotropic regulator of transition state genes
MMKSTGIVRKVDELHRVVIPQELCNTMNIDGGDGMEIFVSGDQIILKKYQPGCIFCGNMEGLVNLEGKPVCPVCIAALGNRVKRSA